MIGSCHSIIECCIGWQMITIFSRLGLRTVRYWNRLVRSLLLPLPSIGASESAPPYYIKQSSVIDTLINPHEHEHYLYPSGSWYLQGGVSV